VGLSPLPAAHLLVKASVSFHRDGEWFGILICSRPGICRFSCFARCHARSSAAVPYCLLVVRYRVLITGQVQGVNFRAACRRMALQHGVRGWVRNLPDGRVEAAFEGSADDVRQLLDWTRRGPQFAVVADVTVQAEQPEGFDTFLIRY